MKPKLELIEITEKIEYRIDNWHAEITCRDTDGDRWILFAAANSIVDVAQKAQQYYEDINNWDMYGIVIESA